MTDTLRKALPYAGVGMAAALLYLAMVFMLRHQSNVDLERPATPPAAARAAPNPPAGLRITQFYADRGEIVKGEHAIVCYGVQDAATVRLDPPVEELKPAMNRCFSVTPVTATTYRLIATSASGSEVSEAFTIGVSPAPPKILFVAISARDLKRGEKFTLCYGVTATSSVRLEPMGWTLPASEKECRMWYPTLTAKLTLIATGEGRRTDRETVTIRVR